MKKIYTLLFGIVLSITILNAQEAPPQAFSYKALIKDKYGLPVCLKPISLRISILQGSSEGIAVYTETFKTTTSLLGQVDIEIGRGTSVLGNFASIPWGTNDFFLKTEADPKGGTSYLLLSVTQLLSVPYSLYAWNAGFALSANEIDGSVTNEIQTLSIDGNVISLSQGGGSVTIPSISTFGGQYYYLDKDGDAYGDNYSPVWVPTGVTPPANFINNSSDCNDNKPAINPEAIEICGNGIDENCDGIDACNTDVDADGDGYMISQGDCSDNDPNIHPGALEICDYKDNDCDGRVDEPPMPNCASPQNMTFTGCNSGMCQFSCLPGWWDLDGDQSNGCESSIPLELSIGDEFQGGKVAYILQLGDPGFDANVQHGLIAAPSDQSTGIIWGCRGKVILGTAGKEIGTGNQNTIAIVLGCDLENIAARLCYNLTLNGYSDWYLPSKDELNKLYLNRSAIGGFTTSPYWSSSEYNEYNYYYAWYQWFNDGSQNGNDKDYSCSVRAVRAF